MNGPRPSRAARVRVRRRRMRGQAMTEMVIVVALALLLLVGVMGTFLSGVGDFYRNLQYVICIPFP